ncbi:alpha-ketoacid dehydrogenase subunit beta [soil metagenome]
MPDTLMPGTLEKLTFAAAANAALRRSLTERPEVIVYGEDVALPGGVFGVTKGLQAEFGDRVFDTPISEAAILGSAIGAAMMGARPVVEIMWSDFMFVAFDQVINQASNVRYLSRGSVTAPLTIRTQQGMSDGACAQHSQSVEALLLHVPGIRVAMPSTAQDAYDILLSAIWTDDPTVVIENRTLYHGDRSEVSTGGPVEEPGRAHIVRPGSDLTLVTWGAMRHIAVEAAESLVPLGFEIEVIDARWLSPFDYDTVVDSVNRTSKLAVLHEATRTGGFGAEVIVGVQERGARLTHVPLRIATPDVRVPAATSMMSTLRPSAASVARSISSYLTALR